MASKTGGSSPHLKHDRKTALKEELLREGHDFSFYQVIRLLRLLASQPSGSPTTPSAISKAIRTKPHLSLAFPASEVQSVEEIGDTEDPQFLIAVNFLGLYGASSPLPSFYTEDLIDEAAEDESVSRDFIDTLNERLFALLFECWGKYRQSLKVVEEKSPEHMERLFCLLGLGEPSFREDMPEPQRLLRYIGLFSQFPRSALGLKTVLTDALGGIPVNVLPGIERKATLPESQSLRMGVSGCRIGTESYLGNQLIDRMGKFRIRIGPLTRADYKRFSPGTEDFERITFLTDLYFVEPLEYDVEVILAEGEALTISLGDATRSTMGVDGWMFSDPRLGEVRAVFNPHRLR
jgi:type VI secretion system protein ImpH